MELLSFSDIRTGGTVRALGYDITVDRRRIGTLALPTGVVVACDPLNYLETEPFDFQVQPDTYPVYIYVAQLRDEPSIAFAAIEFQGAEPTSWEPATVGAGEYVNPSGGFKVDSSIGAFMDEETAQVLMEYEGVVRSEDNDFRRHLLGRLRNRRNRGVGWADVDLGGDLELPVLDDLNVVAFDAEDSPGLYSSWVGYDADKNVTHLVTDLEIVELYFQPPKQNEKRETTQFG